MTGGAPSGGRRLRILPGTVLLAVAVATIAAVVAALISLPLIRSNAEALAIADLARIAAPNRFTAHRARRVEEFALVGGEGVVAVVDHFALVTDEVIDVRGTSHTRHETGKAGESRRIVAEIDAGDVGGDAHHGGARQFDHVD